MIIIITRIIVCKLACMQCWQVHLRYVKHPLPLCHTLTSFCHSRQYATARFRFSSLPIACAVRRLVEHNAFLLFCWWRGEGKKHREGGETIRSKPLCERRMEGSRLPITRAASAKQNVRNNMPREQTEEWPPYLLLLHHHHRHHHLFLNREGRWGITYDFATCSLHFPLFSTALRDLPNSRPVHSLMMSSHLFHCLLCLLPPITVPCKIILARPDEWKTWPYHCSLCLFTMVRRSSCGPIAYLILARTSSFETWFLYEMRSILR